MYESESDYSIGLNIHLLSFILPNKLIHDTDSVTVGITTIPEHDKQNFKLKGKNMMCSNHIFSINITNKTNKIIMVFRKKKGYKQNPIIASTTIFLKNFVELPIEEITEGIESTDVRILDIFYPLQKQIRKEKAKDNNYSFGSDEENTPMKRKVLGEMEVQLSFTRPYQDINLETPKKKTRKFSFGKRNKYQSIEIVV